MGSQVQKSTTKAVVITTPNQRNLFNQHEELRTELLQNSCVNSVPPRSG